MRGESARARQVSSAINKIRLFLLKIIKIYNLSAGREYACVRVCVCGCLGAGCQHFDKLFHCISVIHEAR